MAYRLAIPIGVLCLYAIMAGLWLSGAHSLYFGALRLIGVEAFSFPFLDTHAILAAAQCGRQGIEVYLSNPCDVLGRPHAYSPLWLAILPGSLGTSATGWVGASLDLAFLLSLTVVLRPRTAGELFILGAAAVSPTTVYAVERANNDLAVFLLVVCGAIVFTAPRPFRLFSYGLFVAAGLLKYYPLVLLDSCRPRKTAGRSGHCGRSRFHAAPVRRRLLPRTWNSANEHPRRILVFHRRLLRPEPTVRICGSAGRGQLPDHDRRVAAGRAVGAGSCANASDGSAARARATRLGRERDAIPRHRWLVDGGLLLCRPERRLSRHSSSAGAVRAGLPPSIGQRPRCAAFLRPK